MRRMSMSDLGLKVLLKVNTACSREGTLGSCALFGTSFGAAKAALPIREHHVIFRLEAAKRNVVLCQWL